jgi:uncharacterized protein YndB with AHSA1/START domain
MTNMSRTVRTGQPVDAVWSYLSDFTTSAIWDPHTVSCRRLDRGPLAVGSRFENVQHVAGRDSTLSYRITGYEPGQRMVLEGGNDTVHSRDEMTFTPMADGGTEVTYTVDIELLGVAKVGQPLLAAAMKKIADDGAEGMSTALAAL